MLPSLGHSKLTRYVGEATAVFSPSSQADFPIQCRLVLRINHMRRYVAVLFFCRRMQDWRDGDIVMNFLGHVYGRK